MDGIVTLTSDFGQRDSYVGQMKGAALAVTPALHLVDLCHEVPPGAIDAGAFVLETACRAFPPGTVHVAVVDPGVGTSRGALAVRTERYWFVGPDNGLLGRALSHESIRETRSLEHQPWGAGPRSATFEGRDRFAPAAAWIAGGGDGASLGPATSASVDFDEPPSLDPARPNRVRVIWVDRFGNVILDVSRDRLAAALGRDPRAGDALEASYGQSSVRALRRTYGDVADDTPLLLLNSANYLEIAVCGGRADQRLGLTRGDEVELRLGVL